MRRIAVGSSGRIGSAALPRIGIGTGAWRHRPRGAGRTIVAVAAAVCVLLTGAGLHLGSAAPRTAGGGLGAYRVDASARGITAMNPAQSLVVDFAPTGPVIARAGARLALRFGSLTVGRSASILAPVAPTVAGNTVTYAHPGVSEWYANRPAGLEQGFTVAAPPASAGSGDIALTMRMSPGVEARLALSRKSVDLLVGGRSVFGYGNLVATDAAGHRLRAWLSAAGARLQVHVAAAHAAYPVRIDPLFINQEELGGSSRRFALSGDGNTLLVEHIEHGTEELVFVRSGLDWSQQGLPLVPSEPGAQIYHSAFMSGALSEDGNTALIPGVKQDGESVVFVFERAGASWSQTATLSSPEPFEGSAFGFSVALSSDANTAVVCDPNAGAGAAWVFVRSGGKWSQVGPKLTGATSGGFGYTAALSGDGNTALIAEEHSGLAWVFTRSGEEWTREATPLGIGGRTFVEGPVALSANGQIALLGWDALVYEREGEGWVEQTQFTTEEEPMIGEGAAMSADGRTILIGEARYKEPHHPPIGRVLVFHRSGGEWHLEQELERNAVEEEHELGEQVALSSDASVAIAQNEQPRGALAYSTSQNLEYPYLSPEITELLPAVGPIAGGTQLNIIGRGFGVLDKVSSVSIDGPASYEDLSPFWLRAVTPKENGPFDATVKVEVSTGKDSLANFQYEETPELKSTSPRKGPATGGTVVTITGYWIEGITAVHFGAQPATHFEITQPIGPVKTMTAVAPPNTAGTQPITITNVAGTSPVTTKVGFKVGSPTIASLSPSHGPMTGGQEVTVSGSGYAPGPGATTFLFGKTAATAVACQSTAHCTMLAPPGAKAGSVGVVAEVGKAKSKKAPASEYTYE